MTGPCFYTGTKRNNVFISQDYDLFIFTDLFTVLSECLWVGSTIFHLSESLIWPLPAILINHKTSMVVDPGGEWEEGRVGGVVVVGGDGCRPRGVGGGERYI